jgi:hypothetical protein
MPQTTKSKSKKVYLGVTLPEDLAKRLKDAAKREHRTVSNMLVVFLSKGDNHLMSKGA